MLGSIGGDLCLCNWTNEKHPGRVDKRLQRLLQADYEETPSPVTQKAAKQLDEYFRRERTTFDIPLRFAGTPFQLKVWQLLLMIPYGQTISYGEMARRLGIPQSVRAVANANGANAISIIAPMPPRGGQRRVAHRIRRRHRSQALPFGLGSRFHIPQSVHSGFVIGISVFTQHFHTAVAVNIQD